ncbi:hypothetical protein, partial [Eudoraea chungangensis]|uniref:hypothetical protein n=1 Tax=Eudoraea chungangensis TaxID=1481905 RepID=UPI0023ECA6A1
DAPSAGDDGELTICVGDEQPSEQELFQALTNADAGGTWSGPVNGVYTYTIEASGSCQEDKATVTVKEEDAPSAGDDGDITICIGDEQPSEQELFQALSNADTGGTWSGPVNGVYTYTIEASGSCPEDKATVTVTEEDCVEPPEGCETAFAKDDENNDTCFLDFEDDKGKDLFNRWGWSNYLASEGTYVMDLYAGAGQCITSNGAKSGTVTVTYDAGKVKVEIILETGFVMKEAHLYIGEEPYPVNSNNNKPTVAPGQYPYNAGTLNDVTTYIFEPSETFSGDIYVIVHAVTCFTGQNDKQAVSDTKASIYQKPQSDIVNVDLDINYEANVNVSFQDLSGRTLLKARSKKVIAGKNKLEYNLSGISSQVLIMKVYTGREILAKKILMIK